MGHSSTRAALVYLHARDERARELSDAMGERAERELREALGAAESHTETGEPQDQEGGPGAVGPDEEDGPTGT